MIPGPCRQGNSLILMYHYVANLKSGTFRGQKGLSRQDFEGQIRLLKDHFEPITWEQYRLQLAAARPPEKPTVLFTFDDGLACQATVAAQVLEKQKIRGLFFVPGSVLWPGRLLDAHKLHILGPLMGEPEALYDAIERELARMDPRTDWRRRVDPVRAATEYAYVKDPPSALATDFWRIQQLKFLLNFVLPADVRGALLDRLLSNHGLDEREWAARWYGSVESWKKLQARGHTIGGHGFAHEPLAELSAEAQERDLRASHQALEDLLGPGERPMSYPFGSYNANTAVLARRAGFEAALTTTKWFNDMSTDMYQLRRVDCRREDVEEVLAAMRGAKL